MTNTKAKTKLKCPECGLEKYTEARGLATHRRYAHGVKGTAQSTLHARAKKQQQSEPVAAAPAKKIILRGSQIPHLKGKFECPDCDFVATWKGGLAKHRSAKHNSGEFACSECEETFNSADSLAKHRYRSHGVSMKITNSERKELAKTTQNAVTIAATNGHVKDDEAHRLEAIATLACGRIQQVIEGMAFTHDLPAKTFTGYVLRTLVQAAKVW